MKEIVVKAIDRQKSASKGITDNLLTKDISVAEWERQTAGVLRNLSIWQYSLGVGGIKQMDWKDYAIITGELNFQFQHLRNFSKDILSGTLTEAQIRARTQLYLNRSRNLYERGRLEGHRRNGYLWERRVLATVENCADCIGYASSGWLPIGTLPSPGDRCQCRANCKCTKYYSNSISISRPK